MHSTYVQHPWPATNDRTWPIALHSPHFQLLQLAGRSVGALDQREVTVLSIAQLSCLGITVRRPAYIHPQPWHCSTPPHPQLQTHSGSTRAVAAHAQWLQMQWLHTYGCTRTVVAHTQWLHTHSGCTRTVAAHTQWLHTVVLRRPGRSVQRHSRRKMS